MLSALLLSMPGLTGNISVLQTTGDTSETAPVVDSTSDAATDANANTAQEANQIAALPANSNTAEATPDAETNAAAAEGAKPEANKP